MNIAAILPCRGRPTQTVTNVRRLLATAEYPMQLIAVGARHESDLMGTLRRETKIETFCHDCERLTYWQALQWATSRVDASHLIGLANDLIPGMHWLQRAVDAYQETFGDGPGLLGFNGDSHTLEHSCHFLIDRRLLADYGGWPVWYDHNFGDTELCQRAIADGLYAKAPWAILFHDHPYFGGADDQVYAEGRARAIEDQRLYEQRKARGWPTVGVGHVV